MGDADTAMFLVFIDESGKPDRVDDPYVVCALMIHDSNFIFIEDEIDRIVSDTLGIDRPRIAEIHGKDIFQNKGVYKKMFTMEQQRELVENITRFIENELADKAQAILVVFDKNRVLRIRDDDYIRKYMVNTVYKLLMERIAWMIYEQGPEPTLLLSDQSELDADIIDIVRHEIREGIYTSSILDSKYFIKTPLFVNSKEYRCLQLADLIAYIYGRIHKGKTTIARGFFDLESYFRRISRIIRKGPNGRIDGYGIKIWRE